jgi:flagellin-like protein
MLLPSKLKKYLNEKNFIIKMNKRFNNKKGVSPVIATILLVGIVIVIGLIIFAWLSGLTEESVTKSGENAKLVCEDVEFDSSYSSTNKLIISNEGNVPIYGMEIKIFEGGGFETESIRDLSEEWPEVGINQGQAFSDNIYFDAVKIELIPVILGSSNGEEKTFTCDERHGSEIPL